MSRIDEDETPLAINIQTQTFVLEKIAEVAGSQSGAWNIPFAPQIMASLDSTMHNTFTTINYMIDGRKSVEINNYLDTLPAEERERQLTQLHKEAEDFATVSQDFFWVLYVALIVLAVLVFVSFYCMPRRPQRISGGNRLAQTVDPFSLLK